MAAHKRLPLDWHLPYEEAEQTEECVHEADVMADAGGDGLLAVWTHGLYRSRLEHLALQDGHSGGCGGRGENRGRVTRSEVTGPRTIVLHSHWMMKMPGGRVVTT